jgi:hypothetical protein
MARSQWHKLYPATVAAPPELLFGLLADLPHYGDWLPGSGAFGHTTDVDPYPVRYGSRYHDGKPDVPGKDWWGSVTGFQPPGSLDFHHVIHVPQLRATVDVHIHYSLEPGDGATQVTRWLVLDITMPALLRPLRRLITASFDKENRRTMAALQAYAESQPPEPEATALPSHPRFQRGFRLAAAARVTVELTNAGTRRTQSCQRPTPAGQRPGQCSRPP